MTTVTIILICLCVVAFAAFIILAKKRKRVLATILGFVCVGLIVAIVALSIWGKPISYMNQTKENYLAMQEDKNVSNFRIRVDDEITNKFPEWDDENPFSFFINYQTSEIRIYTSTVE
ncbi:MAG: hypothetical protein IKG67_06295 [Parasporobacterium sp.]|nr:hypothetical protein [Parasporobacterium sp.]